MTITGGQQGELPPDELVHIILRADRLGFSRWRVATALGVSASGLAAIERRHPPGAHVAPAAGHADARSHAINPATLWVKRR
jgi:hypothetical protein